MPNNRINQRKTTEKFWELGQSRDNFRTTPLTKYNKLQ